MTPEPKADHTEEAQVFEEASPATEVLSNGVDTVAGLFAPTKEATELETTSHDSREERPREPEPQEAPEPPEQDDEQDGLTFLIQHDDDEERNL